MTAFLNRLHIRRKAQAVTFRNKIRSVAQLEGKSALVRAFTCVLRGIDGHARHVLRRSCNFRARCAGNRSVARGVDPVAA